MPIRCSSVDLPAPDGPMMETNSPSLMSTLMRRSTKVLVGPCSKIFFDVTQADHLDSFRVFP